MAQNTEALAIQLEDEYCPPLDAATFRSIISDYDLNNPNDLNTARGILDALRDSAALEEATGFDPSGSGGNAAFKYENSVGSAPSATDVTETTSLSNGLASLSIGTREDDSAVLQDMEGLGLQEKEQRLREMFPEEKPSIIAFVLKKNNGDMARVMDELLNHVFFKENADGEDKVATKGVDAFFEQNHVAQKRRKGKNKKGKVARASSHESSDSTSPREGSPAPNKWQKTDEDVKFITSRTELKPIEVSSFYHKCAGSLPATIAAILDKQPKVAEGNCSTEDLMDVFQLREDFPALTFHQAISLLSLTAPSTANAHQLASTLVIRSNGTATGRDGIQVIPQYARYVPTADENRPVTPLERPSSHHSVYIGSPVHLASARNQAFESASQAYRRGKSNHLYGGAAAYYADIGRAHHNALQDISAAEADRLVAAQSGSNYCDLHGVSVKDATRIASERVAEWWHGLGEGRIQGSGWKVGDGFRVVVGRGLHSKEGRAKLGPAVVRRLMAEGWRVEMASGEVVVKGQVKKR